MPFIILSSAKKEKNSRADHKATEMISLFTGGSLATLWETEPLEKFLHTRKQEGSLMHCL